MTQRSWYEFAGSEGAPVLVLAHALGGDASMWDKQVPRLAGSLRVLKYELPGHGRSPKEVGALTLEDLGSDVLSLLDQHGIERAHFCGLSIGGLIGQWLGLNAQHRLRTLILADSAPRMGTVETWNERIEQIQRDGLKAISESTMGRWFTEGFRVQKPEIVEHFKNILEQTSPPDYIACAKVVRDASGQAGDMERFRAIQVPTLILTGKFDGAASPEACAALASHIPSGKFLELNAAHISPVEAADAFTDAVVGFLEGQGG